MLRQQISFMDVAKNTVGDRETGNIFCQSQASRDWLGTCESSSDLLGHCLNSSENSLKLDTAKIEKRSRQSCC
jgi:hypothetical protein